MHNRLPSLLLLLTFTLLVLAFSPLPAQEDNVKLPRHPAVSPDGKEIVFAWRNDLWKINRDGGQAIRLTGHQKEDIQPDWGPDGERIVFVSRRDGYMNLWMMDADGTNLRQVTKSDRWTRHPAFGTDEEGSEILTFSGYQEPDAYREQRPYFVSPEGGFFHRLHDGFGAEPRVSPDGSRVVFQRGGYYHGWERQEYRGSDSMDLWVYHRENDEFEQVTNFEGDDGRPRWRDNNRVLFMSDRAGEAINLYQYDFSGDEPHISRLTNYEGRGVEYFDVSGDGSTVVFHRWDDLYTLDLENPDATPQEVEVTAPEDTYRDTKPVRVRREVDQSTLSPDEQVLAYVAYGRVFIRNIEDNAPTRPVTPDSHARHNHISWSPDGTSLYFSSDRDGTWSLYRATVRTTRREIESEYAEQTGTDNGDGENEENGPTGPGRWHDAIEFNVEPVLQTEHDDRRPRPSPDGTRISFMRNQGDLMIHNIEEDSVRTLVEGWDRRMDWRWSPSGKRIAYSQNDLNFSSNIFIVPADGSSDPVNITRHPRNDLNPRWSSDGRILSFISNRAGNDYDVWKVHLDRELDGYTERELRAYYEKRKEETSNRNPLPTNPDEREEALPEPPELDLSDAYLRLQRMTSFSGGEYSNEMTPSGHRILFTANRGGRSLYSIRWDGRNRKRLSGNANVQEVSRSGNQVVLLRGSRAGMVPSNGGSLDYYDISHELLVDRGKEMLQKFREAAWIMGTYFYHNELNGVDWEETVDRYRELAEHVRTPGEFNWLGNRLAGELQGSHSGVNMNRPGSSIRRASGRLGVRVQPVNMDDDTRGFDVLDIVEGSPADIATMPLEVGDVITGINGEPFGPTETLMTELQGTTDKEIVLTVRREMEPRDASEESDESDNANNGQNGGNEEQDERTGEEENGEDEEENGEELEPEETELRLLITPISYGAYSDLQYQEWQEKNRERVEEWSDGRLGYIHIESMNTPSLQEYERDLYAAAEGKEGLIMVVRNNGGGWTTDRILASIMTREHAYTVPRGANSAKGPGHYPQTRLFIQRYTLPINMVANEKSHSNAEIISHAFKTLDRGNLVGRQTYGGVISTGGHSLIDGTSVRVPFRGWFLPDGTNMEGNGAVPDVQRKRTPADEAADRHPQLRAAVNDLLEQLDENEKNPNNNHNEENE